jgi:hypothetical protein
MHDSLHDFYNVYDALKMVSYELKHVSSGVMLTAREFRYVLFILFGDLLQVFLFVGMHEL